MKRKILCACLIVTARALTALSARADSVSYNFTTISVPGAASTLVTDVNDAGQIVGAYYQTGSNGSNFHGFVDAKGQFTTIDYPGGANSFATGISNSGEVVGQYEPISNPTGENSFTDTNGAFAGIAYPGAVVTQATGVNNSGLVVGGYTYKGSNNFLINTGFLDYGSNGLLALGYPGAQSSGLNRINDSGQIIGNADLDSFLYSNAAFTPITFPGAFQTVAEGLDDNGDIAGFYSKNNVTSGFIDANGVFATFNYPGADATQLFGINDSGDIVGDYSIGDNIYGFLATPDAPTDAPEPATWILFVTGLAIAALWRRARVNA